MTLEDHFRRTFAELTERIRGEVARQAAAAADELIAAADRHCDERVAASGTGRLLDAVRTLDGAVSLSEILDALAEHAGGEMARAAVFLAKGGSLEAWRLVGFGPALGGSRKLHVLLDDAGVMANAVRTRAGSSGSDSAPLFAGLPPGRECLALPLVVAGDVVAVLYGDRGSSESGTEASGSFEAGQVASLEVIVRHAARCLEVITALRAGQVATGRAQSGSSPTGSIGLAPA